MGGGDMEEYFTFFFFFFFFFFIGIQLIKIGTSSTREDKGIKLKDPKADGTTKAVKVVVIADPQLTDRTTHGMEPDSFALKATQFYSDIYMRRAFRTTVLSLKPDEVIFLGDYFDGGPSLSETEFNASFDRFWHIFDQSRRGVRSRSTRVPYHFLYGNHDLGYAGVQSQRPELVERYIRAFGPIEHMDKIGAVNFVFADAQSLDEMSGWYSWWTGRVGFDENQGEIPPRSDSPGGPWKVYGVARRPQPRWFADTPIEYIRCDVLNEADTQEKITPLRDVTHLFWVVWVSRSSEERNCQDNGKMFQNVLNALLPNAPRLQHIVWQTGAKHYVGAFSLAGKSPTHEPPFKENMPRLPALNF
ncbi:hypothetical protein L7F22_060659 [Adiantum nelumboides]|nr:hypothetical protein [Adiantum nelumboides]